MNKYISHLQVPLIFLAIMRPSPAGTAANGDKVCAIKCAAAADKLEFWCAKTLTELAKGLALGTWAPTTGFEGTLWFVRWLSWRAKTGMLRAVAPAIAVAVVVGGISIAPTGGGRVDGRSRVDPLVELGGVGVRGLELQLLVMFLLGVMGCILHNTHIGRQVPFVVLHVVLLTYCAK